MPIPQVRVPDRILVIEKDSAPCLPLYVLKAVKNFKKLLDRKNKKNKPDMDPVSQELLKKKQRNNKKTHKNHYY